MLISFDQTRPLYRQIYSALRSRIALGELRSGEKLPSTRELAAQLGVSRTSVLEAYEQLICEGYLDSRRGSGTYISELLPAEPESRPSQISEGRQGRRDLKPRLSTAAKMANCQFPSGFFSSQKSASNSVLYNFRAGNVTLETRSEKTWQKLLYESCKNGATKRCPPQGNVELRQAIAEDLRRIRNCRCSADTIVITNGSQQAFNILSKLLLDPADRVAVEEPGYFGAKVAFASHSAELVYIPVDQQGMDVSELTKRAANAKLVYVTPSHQFPRGCVMSLERRVALIEWANRQNAYIIEDDYDSQYRYNGRPLECIQSIDPYDRTLYIGTFSKVISPSLRLGYVVLPAPLVDPFLRLRWAADVESPSLQQSALAKWLVEGHHQRHLRRMQKIYGQRRDELMRALNHYFSTDEIQIEGSNTGLHLLIQFNSLSGDLQQTLSERLAHTGFAATPPDFYFHHRPKNCTLVLGFSMIEKEFIDHGIRLLHGIVIALSVR